ncbi:MAG: C25 family cysteine peptidase, partial [Calditrichaceae bacterium]
GLINYTGHGDINGWYTSGFHADDIAGLENGHKLPFIVSVACDNGLFNGEKDCFAETWMKKANGGAVGMLAASVNLPWSSSMRGQDYFMDVLVGGYNYDEHENQYGINTSGQRTTLGSIIFNGFILMLSEMSGYTDIETVQSWNLFGDASMQIRTKAPQAMSLSNSTISVNEPFETEIYSDSAFAGALVTLSQNGRYYSGESDASGRVYIDHDLQAGKAKLVVTAFNMETIYRDIYVLDQTELPGYSMDNTMVECEQGIFFDNGGVNGAYSENENIIMTIYPQTAGTAIHAVFKTFDVDSTDKLYVFNGADVTAEEITGSPFYGSNIPPQISANNPDGALTFHFISDSSLNGEGWLAEISSGVVSAINTKPTAGLTELRLYSNYPNPFNPTTTIPFNLAKNAQVILEVFDMTGKRVSVLIDDAMTAGYHEVKFNAANLSSGIYVYRLQAGSFTRVKKMMILK